MMRYVIANDYGDVISELTEETMKAELAAGTIRLCTAGCNEQGMNDDPIVYHSNVDAH